MSIDLEEQKEYMAENQLTDRRAVVLFGNEVDRKLPLEEILNLFESDLKVYNRSLTGLSLEDSVSAYGTCIAELKPECVLVHLDAENRENFIPLYRNLITAIRRGNRKCRIGLISLDDEEKNLQLKKLAEAESCDYCDISPKYTAVFIENQRMKSFLYNIGFEQTLKVKRPVREIARLVYGGSLLLHDS